MFAERKITIPDGDTISGYTTTFDCLKKRYPFRECIQALLGFCDEVVVVDAGSTDGTIEEMTRISQRESRVKFLVDPVDFAHPRWAIHLDGYLKGKARARCTGVFCWQTDTDEVVPPEDYQKVRLMTQALRPSMAERPVVYMPMVEFWGSFDRIRADFFSWKPRLSVNHPDIVHGIPLEHQCRDEAGHLYPRPFESDSCNYIWRDSQQGVETLLLSTTDYSKVDLAEYQRDFNQALNILPCVLHVSWCDLRRKIGHYREFWPRFHASMYNLNDSDTAERNVMFDKPWSEVTDADIAAKAQELAELGPRMFHTKMDPRRSGNTMPYGRPIPESLRLWAEQQG